MRQAGNIGYTLDLGGLRDARPAVGALSRLREALAQRGLVLTEWGDSAEPRAAHVVAASADSAAARSALASAGVSLPSGPESLALVGGRGRGAPTTFAIGTDGIGLAYALDELADRARFSENPVEALAVDRPRVEQPANAVRGVARLFVSDVEDLGWLRDRDFWRRYLAMLSRHRFNYLHLGFGIGHDFLRGVRDAYLLFPYPFLLDVPGYHVRAAGLPADERDRNLAALRFISDEAASHGLHFQLGLWTHGYRWYDSPEANYTIEGLEPEQHAAYCRTALGQLLSECPSIAGLVLRVHGESGVPEGSHSFWREVFAGATDAGRRIELNLHPKGLDRETIDLALGTGLPVTISPKYAAEHQGLPYHQAAIRGLERETRRGTGDSFVAGLMSRSGGDLRYTRYSYADFLSEDRPYGVYFRVWPGTRRLLLAGDPGFDRALGRSASLGGSLGLDVMEPLSTKGRRGSGAAHDAAGSRERLAYADQSLATEHDFEKYEYTYLLLGRHLYDPDCEPAVWRRYLQSQVGAVPSEETERVLAGASRILPLVTSAHLPSAAHNNYWPELYTNMPIADAGRAHHYGDTPSPKRFGYVSPLDPAIFQSIDDFVRSVRQGEPDPRVSPLRVASWLGALSREAREGGERLRSRPPTSGEARFADRASRDVLAQAYLGGFFAEKLRAGVAYELGKSTGERRWLTAAIERYRRARETWARLAALTSDTYVRDITYGGEAWLRGSWSDRLKAIDQDVADLEGELASAGGPPAEPADDAALEALDPEAPRVFFQHEAEPFRRGEALRIALQALAGGEEDPSTRVWLHYRHVNQAEDYVRVEMASTPDGFAAEIPARYADSPYSLLYFFEVRRGGSALLWPGLGEDLTGQPYFVARMLRSG